MPSSPDVDFEIVSTHSFAEVRRNLQSSQQGLFASQSFMAGEIITPFTAGTISTEPTYLTVQTGIGRHITLQPEFLQYVNHSCAPNVFFNTTSMEFVALKKIEWGEELVFFYPSTEWRMNQGFQCYCGSPGCLGEIRGAAYLPKKILKQFRLTDFILQQLSRKPTRKVA